MRKRTVLSILLTIVMTLLSINFWLVRNGGHTSFKFDIFVIVIVLSFLLFYKLMDYVADYKTIKGKSRIDIIFLTIFFVFLFVPMSHINQDEKSIQENRMLAKWQPLVKDNKLNFNFGKNFETWFNDRFNFREKFISSKYFLNRKLTPNSSSEVFLTSDVIKGSDNWLFLGWKESIESYANIHMFTDQELEKIRSYLENINNYCNKHNKKFYFFIAPDKSKIYEECYNKAIMKKNDYSKVDQLIEYLSKNTNIKIVYPRKELLENKTRGLLYYKQDTHWNSLGAYNGYLELMRLIKKDFRSLSVYKVTKYKKIEYLGDLYAMLPFSLQKYQPIEYVVPDLYDTTAECIKTESERDVQSCKNKKNKINIMVYRDSFSTSLIPYISETFYNSTYIWKYNIMPKEIKNSDIVVLEVVERLLPTLINQNFEDK